MANYLHQQYFYLQEQQLMQFDVNYAFRTTLNLSIIAGPQISTTPLTIHIEISAFPLKSAAPVNAVLIRIVAIFHK